MAPREKRRTEEVSVDSMNPSIPLIYPNAFPHRVFINASPTTQVYFSFFGPIRQRLD